MLKDRFRKYLPVVVDLETGGFDPEINAILEIAITLINEDCGELCVGETHRYHIEPFKGSIVEAESLEFTKIIQIENPHIITGYNINGFDFDFMFKRSKQIGCTKEFLKLSRNKDEICLCTQGYQ